MHTPQGQLAEAWGKEVCAYVPCCRAGDACGFQHPSPISRGTHCKEGNAACRPNRASQVLVRSMLLLLGCSLAVIFNVSADPPQSPRRCGRVCPIVREFCDSQVICDSIPGASATFSRLPSPERASGAIFMSSPIAIGNVHGLELANARDAGMIPIHRRTEAYEYTRSRMISVSLLFVAEHVIYNCLQNAGGHFESY